GGQAGLDVGDLAAKLVPDLGDRVPVEAVLDDGCDHRHPARGLRIDAPELAELLAGLFDRVGDLLGHLLGAGPRVGRDDQRFLDRELRVLEPAHLPVGHNPAPGDETLAREAAGVVAAGGGAGFQGPPPRGASPRSRPFTPSRGTAPPATATRSPGSSPSTISIWPPVASPSFTGRRET